MIYLKVIEKLGFFPICLTATKRTRWVTSSATGAIGENSAEVLILVPSAQTHKV